MSLYIDRKYVSLLSVKLPRFIHKSEYLWNFRCPICGDSKKNAIKARGYIYRRKNDLAYSCKNCHLELPFGKFLKTVDAALYSEYQLEKYQEGHRASATSNKADMLEAFREVPKFPEKAIDLPTIASLPESHPAKVYLKGRQLPKQWLDYLFYAHDFKAFALEYFSRSSNVNGLREKEHRIVIPFYDEKNILQGVQGRALDNSGIRYITLKASDDAKKIFGLDKVDFQKTINVVEGPLDSMFLFNCIATMDSNLSTVIRIVGDYDYRFIFDNQPRNKEIVKQMNRVIENGHKIVIWPNHIQGKDINEMVQEGIEAQWIIDNNTYEGLKAKLQFTMWKKV